MEWLPVVLQIVNAVANFIMEAIKAGSVDAALERPLRDILPGELLSVIAKRQADAEAESKFGQST